MRRLILMRHAKSDWSKSGQPDRDRALNERGRAAAPLMGAYLESHGLTPDLALVSTATRARETWTLVAPHLRKMPKVVFENRLYGAGPELLLDVVQETARGISTLLVLGHNPGLHQFASALAGSGDVEARSRLGEKFPTAGVAAISFAVDDWAGLHPQGGRLERFVSPSALVAEPE